MAKRSRYPGTKPFAAEDQDIFFGRKQEIANILQLLALERTVVLFGKSGIGKSSLLNAGLLPELATNRDIFPINLRTRSYLRQENESLKDIFIQNILLLEAKDSFLNTLIEGEQSFWLHFKKIQRQQGTDKTFVLVFDQFEEFFTHPNESIEGFLKEFSELYHASVPQRFRDEIVRRSDDKALSLSDADIDLLFETIKIKVIFGIREDRLSDLSKLVPYFPSILKNVYELKAFGRQQAMEAIVTPAQFEGKFQSPIFHFTDTSLQKILQTLDSKMEAFECFQMQIICQSIEQRVVREKLAVVSIEHLGNLSKVYTEHYSSQINLLPKDERLGAQLILENLILEKEKRRYLRYEEDLKSTLKVETKLFEKLENLHLIRREQIPSKSGSYYELCHDQFIEPVLMAKQQRLYTEESQRISKEAEERRKNEDYLKEIEMSKELGKLDKEKGRILKKDSEMRQVIGGMTALKNQDSRLFWRIILFRSVVILVLLASIIGIIVLSYRNFQKEDRKKAVLKEMKQLNNELKKSLSVDSLSKTQLRELEKKYEELEKNLDNK